LISTIPKRVWEIRGKAKKSIVKVGGRIVKEISAGLAEGNRQRGEPGKEYESVGAKKAKDNG